MGRIPNPLVYDLLEIAIGLTNQKGRRNLQHAAMRRAVSSAYYALFHALCYVCSDGLVRWSRSDLVARTYRLLDHGPAKSRLENYVKSADAHPSLKVISAAFSDLQFKRNKADYEVPGRLYNKSEALAEINKAFTAISLIETLHEDACRRLAIELLLFKKRD